MVGWTAAAGVALSSSLVPLSGRPAPTDGLRRSTYASPCAASELPGGSPRSPAAAPGAQPAPPAFVDPATRASEAARRGRRFDRSASSRPCTTSISGPAGPRDWDRFKSLLLPECRLMPMGQPAGWPGVYTRDGCRRLHRTRRAELPQAGLLRIGRLEPRRAVRQHRPRVQHLRVAAREERRALRARHQQHAAREARGTAGGSPRSCGMPSAPA